MLSQCFTWDKLSVYNKTLGASHMKTFVIRVSNLGYLRNVTFLNQGSHDHWLYITAALPYPGGIYYLRASSTALLICYTYNP